MSLFLRYVSEGDRAFLEEMATHLVPDAANLVAWLDEPAILPLLAVDGDIPVGLLMMAPVVGFWHPGFPMPEKPSALEVVVLVVDPRYRRRGIGSRLLEEAISYARTLGLDRVVGSTGVGNRALQDLAAKYDFRPFSLGPLYQDGQLSLRLVRREGKENSCLLQ